MRMLSPISAGDLMAKRAMPVVTIGSWTTAIARVRAASDGMQWGSMNPIVRPVAKRGPAVRHPDLAAIEHFAALLVILLAQPDADTAQSNVFTGLALIVCHARAI